MNSLIRKLVMSLGMKWLTSKVRDAAEGRLGPRWQKLYWTTAGLKRITGLGFDVAAGAAAMLGHPTAAAVLAGFGTALVGLGFVDANWRDSSESSWLKDSAPWKFLAHNSPTITAGIGAATLWFQGSGCTLGEWCARGSILMGVLAAGFIQVGIVDAAWNAPAPRVPLP
jgi:hypothetical protein